MCRARVASRMGKATAKSRFDMGHNLGDYSPRLQAQIRAQLYETRRKSQSPVAQRPVCDEPLAAEERETGNASRVRVCITSYRRRLLDEDNLVGKFFLDCARYCGWIPDDTAGHVAYTIRQVKVKKAEDERTEIEIA